MQYIQTKTVYIDRDELIEIKAIEHDVKTRFIDFKFLAANKILDISHCIVRVYALTKNGKEIFNNLTIVDGLKGIARLELTDALLILGTTEYMLKIYDEHGGILSSNIFNLIVSKDLMTGNAIEGTNEYTALDEALKTIGNINATEVRSKENASNIAKITEKLDYSYGYHLFIDHGDGLVTIYAHNSELLVNQGDTVRAGQVIAKSGSTGNSSGPHSHIELRKDGTPVNFAPSLRIGDTV